MKKSLLSIALLLMPFFAMAYDAEVDGIYYNLKSDNTAEVTYKEYRSYNSYSGKVTIPETITNEGIVYTITAIGEYAFSECESLDEVTIPESVNRIEECAFIRSQSLKVVNLPNSVKFIGEYAFANCSKLKSILLPNTITAIMEATFMGCNSLESIIIPNGVDFIDDCAFMNCSSLTSIIIPESVTDINSQAFYRCTNLKSVRFPRYVQYLRDEVFAYCYNLQEFIKEGSPSIYYLGSEIFLQTDISKATLYVSQEYLDKYRTAYPWSGFGTIKALEGTEPEEPETKKCATPTISYADKKLTFACETEGVEYVSEIKDADIKKYYDGEITLSATYEISVYATKTGSVNSDVVTATLVWTTADFTDNGSTSASSAKTIESAAIPLLISANGGMVTICSEEAEGQMVSVYTIDGKALGSDIVSYGKATVATSLKSGQPFIVKAGTRSVKMMML